MTLSIPNQAAGDHELGSFSLAYTRGGERSTLRFDGVPRVASVGREEDFYASVDVAAWTRSVLVDGYNKMQEEVAREVKAGRRVVVSAVTAMAGTAAGRTRPGQMAVAKALVSCFSGSLMAGPLSRRGQCCTRPTPR